MSGTRSSIAVGVFTDRRKTKQAVADLKQAGFRDDKIGVAAKGHDDVTTTAADKKGTHVGEGATVGVAAGASVGALWALGIVAGFLPAIGPVVAGGIFALYLGRRRGRCGHRGYRRRPDRAGHPRRDANYYEGEFEWVRVLVTVQATAATMRPGRS